ncbi:hypothetical protein GZL_07276 [Streptomyces sp. 769]|nr:hypothetical protein GZL_07276 [Streptomyces sp. 769]
MGSQCQKRSRSESNDDTVRVVKHTRVRESRPIGQREVVHVRRAIVKTCGSWTDRRRVAGS